MDDEIPQPPPVVNPAFPPERDQFAVTPPPVSASYQPPPGPPKSGVSGAAKKAGPIATALAVFAAKAKTVGTVLISLLKFAKLGKFLLTGGTMILSVWAYAQWFGVPFAIGFVLLIFVHEMGHVFAAWKMGIPVSAPIFIPFMGALILTKKFGNKEITKDALIGIGGPLFGTAGAIVCAGIYLLSGSLFFLGLAYITFFINLFNLTPIYPLDGGWIVRAVSPVLWVLGVVIMGFMVVTGQIHNPMIFILIILGIPTMWTEFGAMIKKAPSPVPTDFRWKMGAAYVGLILVCVVGMSICFDEMKSAKRGRSGPVLAIRWGRRPGSAFKLQTGYVAELPSAV